MFYAQSSGGFYTQEFHGDRIPPDAVKLTDAQYAELIAGQRTGKQISIDADGHPVLIEPPKATAEHVWSLIKAERDRRIRTGGFKVGEVWFHSDPKSRSQQQALFLLSSNLPDGLQWKTMDGSFVAMTTQLAQMLLAAAMASDIAIFEAAEAHRSAMETSVDPSAYDFSAGWPLMFGEEDM